MSTAAAPADSATSASAAYRRSRARSSRLPGPAQRTSVTSDSSAQVAASRTTHAASASLPGRSP